jgi:hypothetical protein
LEWLHDIARYQRSFAADDPGNLDFIMLVQVFIKVWQNIFLNVY